MEHGSGRVNGDVLNSGVEGVRRLVIAAAASGDSTVATSYQMKPHEHCIVATTALNDAAAIIILPSLAEAAGKFYSISAPTGATGGDISVYEKETGAELSTYGDLNADDDHVVLYSDGLAWRVALDGVA